MLMQISAAKIKSPNHDNFSLEVARRSSTKRTMPLWYPHVPKQWFSRVSPSRTKNCRKNQRRSGASSKLGRCWSPKCKGLQKAVISPKWMTLRFIKPVGVAEQAIINNGTHEYKKPWPQGNQRGCQSHKHYCQLQLIQGLKAQVYGRSDSKRSKSKELKRVLH